MVWFRQVSMYNIYSGISIVLGHVYSMWDSCISHHTSSLDVTMQNKCRITMVECQKYIQLRTHDMIIFHRFSLNENPWSRTYGTKQIRSFRIWNLCCSTCWLRTHIFMSWLLCLLSLIFIRETMRNVRITINQVQKCDTTIPPLNSHFLTSETQQASFLYGKYEPSEGIVSSHILDDWLF